MNFDISKLANLKEGAGQRKPSLFKPKGARPTPTKQTQATQEAEPATQPLTSQTQDVAAHVAPSHGGVSASAGPSVTQPQPEPQAPRPASQGALSGISLLPPNRILQNKSITSSRAYLASVGRTVPDTPPRPAPTEPLAGPSDRAADATTSAGPPASPRTPARAAPEPSTPARPAEAATPRRSVDAATPARPEASTPAALPQPRFRPQAAESPVARPSGPAVSARPQAPRDDVAAKRAQVLARAGRLGLDLASARAEDDSDDDDDEGPGEAGVGPGRLGAALRAGAGTGAGAGVMGGGTGAQSGARRDSGDGGVTGRAPGRAPASGDGLAREGRRVQGGREGPSAPFWEREAAPAERQDPSQALVPAPAGEEDPVALPDASLAQLPAVKRLETLIKKKKELAQAAGGHRTLQHIIAESTVQERIDQLEQRRKSLAAGKAQGGGGKAQGGAGELRGERGSPSAPRGPAAAPTGGDGEELAVQVRIVDGQIQVDERRLVVETRAPADEYRRAAPEGSRGFSLVPPRDVGPKWTDRETDLFYLALEQFGTDFSLISKLFPGRTRPHIKRKFVKEKRSNRAKVDAALEATQYATSQETIARMRFLTDTLRRIRAEQAAQEGGAADIAAQERLEIEGGNWDDLMFPGAGGALPESAADVLTLPAPDSTPNGPSPPLLRLPAPEPRPPAQGAIVLGVNGRAFILRSRNPAPMPPPAPRSVLVAGRASECLRDLEPLPMDDLGDEGRARVAGGRRGARVGAVGTGSEVDSGGGSDEETTSESEGWRAPVPTKVSYPGGAPVHMTRQATAMMRGRTGGVADGGPTRVGRRSEGGSGEGGSASTGTGGELSSGTGDVEMGEEEEWSGGSEGGGSRGRGSGGGSRRGAGGVSRSGDARRDGVDVDERVGLAARGDGRSVDGGGEGLGLEGRAGSEAQGGAAVPGGRGRASGLGGSRRRPGKRKARGGSEGGSDDHGRGAANGGDDAGAVEGVNASEAPPPPGQGAEAAGVSTASAEGSRKSRRVASNR